MFNDQSDNPYAENEDYRKLERLKVLVKSAHKMLKEMEWIREMDTDLDYNSEASVWKCPICKKRRDSDHKQDCQLKLSLLEMEEEISKG